MAAALTLLAKQRGDVTFVQQSLYYPVTDGAQDTDSYREFAEGPFLTAKAMAWYWDAYLPEYHRRSEITASPHRATLDDLAGLPEAFVVVDENDVLRDEGEAYARRLAAAGVRTTSVRFNGIIHDFMMLNPLRGTAATTAAVEQAVADPGYPLLRRHPRRTQHRPHDGTHLAETHFEDWLSQSLSGQQP